jgi:N-acetylglucosamine kinase-like BadF-type ATPase
VSIFLGVDGGGTKTEFVLINGGGALLATHQEGSLYYPEVGLQSVQATLARGIGAVCAKAGQPVSTLSFSFLGVPSYGEDSSLTAQLDALAEPTLKAGGYVCGNDAVCGWAGALACSDGINVVAGTGSIAYGQYQGREARAGGWGELFGDEGSAHWIAREALNRFSRMSDRRAPKGELHKLMRKHFRIWHDLDLCAAIYGSGPNSRSQIAQIAPLVSEAAAKGDTAAVDIFKGAAFELASLVRAVRGNLEVPAEVLLPVTGSGSLFSLSELLLEPFKEALKKDGGSYAWQAAKLPPGAGAAVYAAQLNKTPLNDQAVAELKRAVG